MIIMTPASIIITSPRVDINPLWATNL
jgi:hypothetical protein